MGPRSSASRWLNMDRLEIEISGSEEVFKQLQNVQGLLIDPTAILDEAAALILNRMRRNFLTQTAPDGTKWPESAAARRRAETGRGGGTLFDTGQLFRSIQLFSIGPNERSIATDVEYAPIHNYGTAKMIARVFMGFSEADAALAQGVALKKIKEALS